MQCEVALTTLFDQPVLHALASKLTDTMQHDLVGSALPDIVPIAAGEKPPLSLAQKRLWFLAQMDPTTTAAYVIAGGVRLKGELNVDALQKALNQIVARHAPLRTHFADADGVPVQIIGDVNQGFPVTWLDGEAMLDELAPFRPEFDLTTGPLVQGQLIRTGDDEHWLRLAMHHMITDGWSLKHLYA
ncbi:condensation domain-containing protein [Vibrio sp. PP-XX7]